MVPCREPPQHAIIRRVPRLRLEALARARGKRRIPGRLRVGRRARAVAYVRALWWPLALVWTGARFTPSSSRPSARRGAGAGPFTEASTIPQSGAIALNRMHHARAMESGAGQRCRRWLGHLRYPARQATRCARHRRRQRRQARLHPRGPTEATHYRSDPSQGRTTHLDLIAHPSVFVHRCVLACRGRYLCVGGRRRRRPRAGWWAGSPTAGWGARRPRVCRWPSGALWARSPSRIHRTFALDEVPAALAYVGCVGKVVILLVRSMVDGPRPGRRGHVAIGWSWSAWAFVLNVVKLLADQPVDVVAIDQRNYNTFQPLLYLAMELADESAAATRCVRSCATDPTSSVGWRRSASTRTRRMWSSKGEEAIAYHTLVFLWSA